MCRTRMPNVPQLRLAPNPSLRPSRTIPIRRTTAALPIPKPDRGLRHRLHMRHNLLARTLIRLQLKRKSRNGLTEASYISPLRFSTWRGLFSLDDNS